MPPTCCRCWPIARDICNKDSSSAACVKPSNTFIAPANPKQLNDEIKYLADIDAMRAQHGYAFVRVIIWAIPILGLLGTVIGITSVFANLDIKHFDASLPMVLSGLQVAFDTTGLALAMSMLLMFGQYFVDRTEQGLLAEVDVRVNSEWSDDFTMTTDSGDPQLGPMRRMVETVVHATERLVARQAEIWRGTIEVAEERHRQLATNGGKQLETALAGALEHTLKTHATTVAATERQLADQNHRQWSGVQQALAAIGRSHDSATMRNGTAIGIAVESHRGHGPDRRTGTDAESQSFGAFDGPQFRRNACGSFGRSAIAQCTIGPIGRHHRPVNLPGIGSASRAPHAVRGSGRRGPAGGRGRRKQSPPNG